MQPFESLTHHAQVLRLRELAANALTAYDLGGEMDFALQLHLANTTFRVTPKSGGKYMLRICQPDYRTVEELRSEAMWLAALRQDTPLSVPEPIPTASGELLTVASAEGVPEPRQCMLFRWMNGRFHRRSLKPADLAKVGELTARLHDHAAYYTLPPGFTRPREEVMAWTSRWYSETIDPEGEFLTLEDRVMFSIAAKHITGQIRILGTTPDRFGLIHTDLHQGNYLFHHGEARAIDFDDCGFEHYVYDLAVTLWALAHHSRYEAMRAALLAGYESVRALPIGWDTHLETFMAARFLIVTRYVIGRAADNPGIRRFAPRYIALTRDFLKKYLDS